MNTLNHFLPAQSVKTISKWLTDYDCTLTVKKSRSSKLGDYRYFQNKHYITINENLNPQDHTRLTNEYLTQVESLSAR